MQAIALHPKRSQITGQLIALAALILASFLSPVLCLPAALTAPLFSCPIAGLKRGWAAYPAIAAPALISLASGFDWAYSLTLLLPGALTLCVAFYQQRKKTAVSKSAPLYYIAAYALSLSAIVFFGARALGGDLVAGLSRVLTDSMRGSSGSTLYQLAASGLVGVPSAYRRASIISFALDPILRGQLLLSLGLTLRLMLGVLIPQLFVDCCVVCGLMTSLRLQKLNHSFLLVRSREGQKVDPDDVQLARPFGFAMLSLPKCANAPILVMALLSLVLPSTDVPLLQTLGTLCNAAFQCAFRLCGAAVVVCLLSARKPEMRTVFGVLAAVMYALVPAALFIIGLADQLLHFRSRTLNHQEEE